MTSRDAFQKRILGLTSYFGGAPEELMPKYDRNRDFVIIRVPMSDYQASGYKKALEKDDKDKEKDKFEEMLNETILGTKPNVKWDDIAGLENAKKAL